jgi:hypothetical protein
VTDTTKPVRLFKGRTAGIYRKLREDEYHDVAAASASFLWDVETRALRYAWHRSPFNPDYQPVRKKVFDIGTAVHLSLLEPARMAEKVRVIHADNFLTKAAQKARDEAYEEDKVPILAKDFPTIEAMRKHILEHPVASQLFSRQRGDTEVTGYFYDPRTNVPCKLRVDHVLNAGNDLVDIKTMSNCKPSEFAKRYVDGGHHARAAWYLNGWEILTGRRPKNYWFLCVERDEPHLVSVIRATPRAIEWGDILNRKALDTFAKFWDSDDCPGYVDDLTGEYTAFDVELPAWYETSLFHRYQADAFELSTPGKTASELRVAYEGQAPLGIEAGMLPEDERL